MLKYFIEQLKTLAGIMEEHVFDVYFAFYVICLIIIFFIYISE